jgi:hypothetical protein
MKHISAILGKPNIEYIRKFAWFPKRLSNDKFIWLKDYYVQQLSWDRYDTYDNMPKTVLSLKYISLEDATIEKLKEST